MSERLPDGRLPLLEWDFDDQGEWCATSAMKDADGDALFQYRIQVCRDGTFDITASDKELGLAEFGLAGRRTTELFRNAVNTCEYRENQIRERSSDDR